MENEKRNQQLKTSGVGSQASPVNRFGVSPVDKRESASIKNRLDETRAKNINSRNDIDLNTGLPNSPRRGLDKKPGLDDSNHTGLQNNDNNNDSNSSGNSSKGMFSSNQNNKNSRENNSVTGIGGSAGNGIGDVKSTDNGLKSNDKSLSNSDKGNLGLGIGKALGNTALNVASNNNETVNKAVNTVRTANMAVKGAKAVGRAVKAIIAFFSSLFGLPLAVMAGIVALIILIIVVIAMIVNSLGSKFGLTGNEVVDIFNGTCPEGYSKAECEKLNNLWEEGMTREEVEKIMSDAEGGDGMCKLGLFASFRNFFGVYNLEDPCELAHYVKHLLESKEKSTGIKTIDPGYFMGTLYYSFDTQNYDENGNPYLVPENYDPENPDVVTDLDAITTLFATKPAIYNKGNIITLLNKYVFDEEHDYREHYHYWLWERPIIGYNNDGTPIYGEYDCFEHDEYKHYEIDVLQFKLYLRYGDKITSKDILNEYYDDKMVNYTYDLTSPQCKYKVLPKRDMSKYQTKADPGTLTDDHAKIDGVGYDSGFIYTTFPRYNPKYIPSGELTYDFKTDKDIEQIIDYIDSRQDYTNYVLGYPNSVKTDYTIGGNTSSSSGASCLYNVNGIDYGNIKVQLVYGPGNSLGKSEYDPIEGQGLIDFEQYVLGVTYAEIGNGNGNPEAVKTQAIAARSYALGAANSGMAKLEQVNGQWVLSIANSTYRQVYCDPDKGCNKQCGSTYTVFTEGTKPSGLVCSSNLGGISSDSTIRSSVRETAGMFLVNSSGKVVQTGYRNTPSQPDQSNWMNWASQGLDYVEILRKQYGDLTIATNKCTVTAGGFVLPIDGELKVSSCFGLRKDPFTGELDGHTGTDIPKPMNDPIYSIADGTVYAVVPMNNSYGNYIMIDHGNGYMSLYAHMNKFVDALKVGDTVHAGQQIGFIGTTGRSTGPHLHLEIRINGKRVDALEVMGITGFCGR